MPRRVAQYRLLASAARRMDMDTLLSDGAVDPREPWPPRQALPVASYKATGSERLVWCSAGQLAE